MAVQFYCSESSRNSFRLGRKCPHLGDNKSPLLHKSARVVHHLQELEQGRGFLLSYHVISPAQQLTRQHRAERETGKHCNSPNKPLFYTGPRSPIWGDPFLLCWGKHGLRKSGKRRKVEKKGRKPGRKESELEEKRVESIFSVFELWITEGVGALLIRTQVEEEEVIEAVMSTSMTGSIEVVQETMNALPTALQGTMTTTLCMKSKMTHAFVKPWKLESVQE